MDSPIRWSSHRVVGVASLTALLVAGFVTGPASARSSEPSVAAVPAVRGTVLAWGGNFRGDVFVPPEAQQDVVDIAAGAYFTLALRDGEVLAWGSDEYGQTSVPPSAKSGVTAIAAGGSNALAVKGGAVIAWGAEFSRTRDVPVEAQSGVTDVAVSDWFALAIKDGAVLGWGSDAVGTLDIPAEASSGVTAIAAGYGHALAIKDGGVIAWGWSLWDATDVPESARSDIVAIAAGRDHSVALNRFGRVIVWGGSELDDHQPIPVELQSGVSAIAAGNKFSVAVKDGRVIVWGSPSNFVARIPVDAQAGVVAVAAGTDHVVGIRAVTAPPDAPRNVQVAGEDSSLRVTWEHPGSTSQPVQSFTATATPSGRSCTTAGETTCVIEGLVNGTSYTVTVVAGNSAGSSPPSRRSSSVTAIGPPTPPTMVSAYPGNGELEVSWQPPANPGGVPLSEYIAYAFPGGATCTTTGALRCTITGLTNGVAYSYAVTAANPLGVSPPAEAERTSTPTPAVPTAPVNVTAEAGDGQVEVAWDPPQTSGASPIDGYVVTSWPDSRTCSTTGAQSCVVKGLTNGVSYEFTVSASNSRGRSAASVGSTPVTPQSPITTPTGVTRLKAAPRKGSLRVTWQPPADLGGADEVTYRYRVNKKRWKTTSSRSIIVKGKAGALITVQVAAVNSAGVGPAKRVSARPR